MMSATQKLEALRIQEEALQRQIRNCQHDFLPAKSDPETKTEFRYEMVARGSDVMHEPTGSYKKTIPRWSRECSKCGFKQYTYEQAPVVERYEPKFK